MFNEFIIINKNIQQCKQNSLLNLNTSTKLHIAKTDNSTKFTKLTHTNNNEQCAKTTLNAMFDSMNKTLHS